MTDDSAERFISAPPGWAHVPEASYQRALSATLTALDHDLPDGAPGVRPVTERLGKYYDPAGQYAGRTFLHLKPHVPDAFTVADLYAATLLRVKIDALSTRRFLDPGPRHAALSVLLQALPTDAQLAQADEDMLSRMAALQTEVTRTLAPSDKGGRSNKWVTAAKLCARKRPDLFPVRDGVVQGVLGLQQIGNHEIDYLVYRMLMRNQHVQEALTAAIARTRAAYPKSRMDTCRLRILDVALWTYSIWRRS